MVRQSDKVSLQDKISEAFSIMDAGIEQHITSQGKELAAICVLFSGGKDSTVLAHLFKSKADFAVHINTTIGIEKTRQFVRDTCKSWKLPLIERKPPQGSTYEELVIDQGFPGPGHHWKMYQRLKERALRIVRRELVTSRSERVVFLAGRRRSESKRRMNVPEMEREGSVVWISPIVNWTAMDLSDYRAANPDCPSNPVSDLIHMSGECLCGAFASPGERKEIGFWFPEVERELARLESLVTDVGSHPTKKCRWGWGAGTSAKKSKSGHLCSSCDAKATGGELVIHKRTEAK